MLNYDTLLSSYDDKLTLMQWLKKVEEALKGASAVSFKVNKRGDGTATFSVVFEDGSEIESNPITLPQGKQGESVKSAYIQNGNLHLVLTNGDDLSAGNMFDGDIALSGILSAAGVTAGGVDAQDVSAQSIKTHALTSDAPEIAAEAPVVEVMKGYSFERGYSGTTYDIGVTYAGAVKNGNKLTLSLAFSIKRKGDVATTDDYFPAVGKFAIPSSLFGRLVADGTGRLDYKRVLLFPSIVDTPIPLTVSPFKHEDKIEIQLIYPDQIPLNKIYYSRYEVTFLLSDNMAA